MVGGHFQHDICSSQGSVPKYIEWVKGHHYADISIHIDTAIKSVPDPRKRNFAWLVEPLGGNPPLKEWIYGCTDWLTDHFELIFTHEEHLLHLSQKFKLVLPNAVSWIKEHKIYEKSKLVSMIATNKTDSVGHRYRRTVMEKYKDDVDLYGLGTPVPKILAMKDYMFSIVMDSSTKPQYFTEKINDCFVTGTIPIFWGNPKIHKFFNMDGVIFLDSRFNINDLSEELYYSKMDAIKENFEIAKNFPIAEDYIYKNYIK